MTIPVASLPMYDWPEVRWATDALWAGVGAQLRQAGIAAPDALDRSRRAEDVWLDPGLVLSQTCGWPYATQLHGWVRLVATPRYAVEGCEGGFYSSALIARRSDPDNLAAFKGRRFAMNGRESLSGYVALRIAMGQTGIDPAVVEWVETGSHRASVASVANGTADCAAIDAVSWDLAKAFDPDAVARLQVIGWTGPRPALPFIASQWHGDAEALAIREALRAALHGNNREPLRAALRIADVVDAQAAEYRALSTLLG